jgi:hypothetical protein
MALAQALFPIGKGPCRLNFLPLRFAPSICRAGVYINTGNGRDHIWTDSSSLISQAASLHTTSFNEPEKY